MIELILACGSVFLLCKAFRLLATTSNDTCLFIVVPVCVEKTVVAADLL